MVTGLNEKLGARTEIYTAAGVVSAFIGVDIAVHRHSGRIVVDANIPKRIAGDGWNQSGSRKQQFAVVESVSTCDVRAESLFFDEIVTRVHSQAPHPHGRTEGKTDALGVLYRVLELQVVQGE